jgi:hypothetical protein
MGHPFIGKLYGANRAFTNTNLTGNTLVGNDFGNFNAFGISIHPESLLSLFYNFG